jgi:hypothetical protein
MRSTVLRKVLQGIVASVVPAASFAGCGVLNDMDCYGQEGQSRRFRTLDNSGHLILAESESPPVIPDGGVDFTSTDAGPDVDAGAPTCVSACTNEGSCGGESLRDCSIIGRSFNRWYVRCDYDTHQVCMPKGEICGRRPDGWRQPPTEHGLSGGVLAAFLSRQATLEAASVPAFHALARELEAHGAPRALCRAAKRAAADEVRHARTMSELARNRGGRVNPPRVRRGRVRSLSRVAIDNCVEGCVRETFGAMVAMWQAREAKDPQIRAAMERIANEELRHAALAFRISEWIEPRLDAKQIAQLARARKRAVAELRREVAWEPPRGIVATAGLPTSNRARQLFDRAADALWPA